MYCSFWLLPWQQTHLFTRNKRHRATHWGGVGGTDSARGPELDLAESLLADDIATCRQLRTAAAQAEAQAPLEAR